MTRMHEFYSIKHRKKVQIEEKDLILKTYERETSKGKATRYAFQVETTVNGDRVKLTKFVQPDVYNKVKNNE